ncbi:MAG: autotransporter outer membrane beta-barrel domain-containing protein [Puniceicoccales bacterium]|nr:autotransporter outer membrane beta-barrel domain-containing protein [Puniceicoccales bacterium]
MIKNFSLNLRKFQAFLIVVLFMAGVLFSGSNLWSLDGFSLTPAETARLGEGVDAAFAEDSTLQQRLEFGQFIDSLHNEDFESDQSLIGAARRYWNDDWSDPDIMEVCHFWPGGEMEYVAANVNSELASLTLTANTLVTNAFADRMISVKGCLADPFIHIIYGHTHQNEIAKLGYNGYMGGFVIGLDDVWTFTNERYLRMGAAFGYAAGKTVFSGSAIGLGKSAKHDIYTIELFSAYEFFNDKYLKGDVGVIVGYSCNEDRLHRTDLSSNVFDAKVRSDNIFVGIEIVKNLYAYKGCQFGLWFRGNYSHIAQKGYDESTAAAIGARHVSPVNHDFLTTVVGFNIEKEIPDLEQVDKKFTLSLKAGWEWQAIWKYSDATLSFDNNLGIGKFAPTFRHPSRSAAIISFGASQKFNVHWSVVGSYIARFNKDISTHNLSLGAEYSF